MKAAVLKQGAIVHCRARSSTEEWHWYDGCFAVVTECKPWGIIGYVPTTERPGIGWVRLEWAAIEPTGGMAPWIAA